MSQYLGDISAHALAVSQGYTGTEDEFAELMASYATVGQTAVDAKDAAVAAKTAAQTAATTATNKASEATTAAQTATTKAGEASQSASQASASAQTASTKASEASASASTASAKATEATTAAGTATTAKNDAVAAKTAAETAQGKAETAQGAAEGSAASIASSAAQIAQNTADITELNTHLNEYCMSRYGALFSYNMIDGDESLTSGYIAKNGSISSSSSYVYTDYIPVKEGDVLRIYYTNMGVFTQSEYRFLCCYDDQKNVLSDKGDNSGGSMIIVPSGVSYIRPSIAKNISLSHYMLTLNYEATEYHEYSDPIRLIVDDFLALESQEAVDRIKNRSKYGCALPRTTYYGTVDINETWYYKSAITPPSSEIYVSVGGHANRFNDHVYIYNNSAGQASNGYSWWWYDSMYELIDEERGSAGYGQPERRVAENLSDCTLLAIGDSTVDHDTMTATLLSHFAEQNHTLTLLGTLGDGSGTNKNEGRSGWRASDYFTNRQYNGVTNPFYNPTTETFDFAYYMTNQGYSAPDFVVIQLGINDLYNSDDTAIVPTWNYVKGMIDSILTYNSAIKIILNLPTTPNSDQSKHSVSEFLYRNRVIRYNEYAMSQALSNYGNSKVRCSYCHLILDPDVDINDNVHPTTTGYQKMALEVINQINCWQQA